MSTELARTQEVQWDESFESESELTWRGITISVIGWLDTEQRDVTFRWRHETQGIYDGDIVTFMAEFPGEEPTLANAERLVDAIAKDPTQPLARRLAWAAAEVESECWDDLRHGEAEEAEFRNWQTWGCWL